MHYEFISSILPSLQFSEFTNTVAPAPRPPMIMLTFIGVGWHEGHVPPILFLNFIEKMYSVPSTSFYDFKLYYSGAPPDFIPPDCLLFHQLLQDYNVQYVLEMATGRAARGPGQA